MDEKYDVVVLGTGLSECVLSSLLSMEGKKVLHMDRNDYYGGECASLNLTQDGQSPPADYGKDRDYNIDLMANGELVKILLYTDVTRYLEFQQIAGSFVYRDGKISKVPATQMEAVTSPLMGFFEKRRAKSFFEFIQNYKHEDPNTHQGIDLEKTTMLQFGLESGTQDFIGHAMALHPDEEYLNKAAIETFDRITLYVSSLAKYGKSPYIYPMYGLSELPQGFASAIYGGTYMLDKPFDGLVMENGIVVGVKSGQEVIFYFCSKKVAKCGMVIGDPSYFPDKSKVIGKVIRSICLLKQPIPNTGDADSCQIIIPQRQLSRKTDIYIACVCANGYYIAIVSTICETSLPEKEIEPAYALLGHICDKFVTISDLKEPMDDGKHDNVFVTRTFDATSHFETVCNDIKDVYERVTGKPLDLSNPPNKQQN
ncbi:Rab GDI protein domain-containing protein [Rozella allomycis CSF55]|uniref:Rab GDP dissociation inhibitor n=1 Tax=Rozella allomycis (strain CSF55) TaxID=988480 RepID=A0A075AYZ3_ROZAC|nr:Rab GDI protein domain-containing protein [Rozella allomycis CSF55]|eukprot:EPZ35349.1 Rab GDI protein domain-containing protein [Rozella allomycis CSF55]